MEYQSVLLLLIQLNESLYRFHSRFLLNIQSYDDQSESLFPSPIGQHKLSGLHQENLHLGVMLSCVRINLRPLGNQSAQGYDVSILLKNEPLHKLHLEYISRGLVLLFQFLKGYLACRCRLRSKLGLELQ